MADAIEESRYARFALRCSNFAERWFPDSWVFAALAVIDGRFDLFNRNTNGPVMTLIILAVVVPVALLGLRRATEAGLMLLLIGLTQLLGSGILHGGGEGAMWRPALGGSAGVIVLPILLAALLLLLAGRLDHERVSFWPHRHSAPPAY